MLLAAIRRLKGCLAQVQEIHEKAVEGEVASYLRQKIELDLEECDAVLGTILREMRSSNR
jgi:hypothetical protein